MGRAVPRPPGLAIIVVMDTPWPRLGSVHVWHGEIQALREHIDLLEARLSADPSNSNKPPSRDTLDLPCVSGVSQVQKIFHRAAQRIVTRA